MDALRPLCDAERHGMHAHAERGNDQVSDESGLKVED
jgi:hypothetical protein